MTIPTIHNKLQTFIPQSVTNTAMFTYIAAMMCCNILFVSHILHWQWWFFGAIEVLGFFYFANSLSKGWFSLKPKHFTQKLFWMAFILRLVWVIVSYGLYYNWTGTPFTISAADELFYDDVAHYAASLLREGNWRIYDPIIAYSGSIEFSDMGYPIYLSIIYWIFGDSILIARVIKAALSAWTAVLIYKVTLRNFGESIGRMAGVLCMLMPKLILYCSFQLKEVEMVFLAMLFVERVDWLLKQPRLKIISIITVMLIPLALFMVRTALAATLVIAFFCALLLTAGRVSSLGKRIVIIVATGIFVVTMLFASTSIGEDVQKMWQEGAAGQQANMEWRAIRNNGNMFAKYASAAIFAPMIFTIPFPTMIETPQQEHQKIIHGGNYVKNILSFFTIVALFTLLISGDWRKHVLPIAVLCGYLVVLMFSSYAQSGRFHQPILPLIIMFASVGISSIKEKPWIKQYFNYWCILIFLISLAWNWFKLAGRGMI